MNHLQRSPEPEDGPTTYRCLSLWEPWGTLIARGDKTCETRSWSTSHRGPMAIATAKTRKGLESLKQQSHGWIGRYQVGKWTEDVHHAGCAECDCTEFGQLADDPFACNCGHVSADHAGTCECDFDEETIADSCGAEWIDALLNDEGAHGWSLYAPLTFGAVVATCELVDVVPITDHYIGRECVVNTGDGLDHCIPGETADDAPQYPLDYFVVRLDPIDMSDSYLIRDVSDQRPYGNYSTDGEQRYAWLLENVVPLDPPVPVRGRQGLFRVEL